MSPSARRTNTSSRRPAPTCPAQESSRTLCCREPIADWSATFVPTSSATRVFRHRSPTYTRLCQSRTAPEPTPPKNPSPWKTDTGRADRPGRVVALESQRSRHSPRCRTRNDAQKQARGKPTKPVSWTEGTLQPKKIALAEVRQASFASHARSTLRAVLNRDSPLDPPVESRFAAESLHFKDRSPQPVRHHHAGLSYAIGRSCQ